MWDEFWLLIVSEVDVDVKDGRLAVCEEEVVGASIVAELSKGLISEIALAGGSAADCSCERLDGGGANGTGRLLAETCSFGGVWR